MSTNVPRGREIGVLSQRASRIKLPPISSVDTNTNQSNNDEENVEKKDSWDSGLLDTGILQNGDEDSAVLCHPLLKPTRKKLTVLESQRIMTLVSDTMKRIEVMCGFDYIVENLGLVGTTLSTEHRYMIRNHKVTIGNYLTVHNAEIEAELNRHHVSDSEEEEYEDDEEEEEDEDMMQTDDEHKDQSPKEQIKPKSAPVNIDTLCDPREFAAVMGTATDDYDLKVKCALLLRRHVQESSRDILRRFRDNQVGQKMALDNVKTSTQAEELLERMNDIKHSMMTRLLTTPAEQQEREQSVADMIERTAQNDLLIQKLEDELMDVLRDKDNKCRTMNEVIRKIQADILTVEKISEENIRRTRSEAAKQQGNDVSSNHSRMAKLSSEANQSKSRFQKLHDDHWSGEAVLRRKKFKVETEIGNWVSRYDTDMGALQDTIDEVTAAYAIEKKQLDDLEIRFKPLNEDFQALLEVREVAHRKELSDAREQKRRKAAACTLQAWWRSFRVRKVLKAKAKKDAKKKKVPTATLR